MTAACPFTLGAVKPTFTDPSLFAAEPLMTARIESALVRASFESFQNNDSDSTTAHAPGGVCIERTCMPVWRCDSTFAIYVATLLSHVDGHATRECHVTRATQQILAGEMCCQQ